MLSRDFHPSEKWYYDVTHTNHLLYLLPRRQGNVNKVDFLLVECLYKKQNNTCLLGEMEFLFAWLILYVTSVGSAWVRYPVEHLAIYYSLFLLCCILQHFSEITNFVINLQGRKSIGWLANIILPWKRQYDQRWLPNLQFNCKWKLPVISHFFKIPLTSDKNKEILYFNLWQNLWKDIC